MRNFKVQEFRYQFKAMGSPCELVFFSKSTGYNKTILKCVTDEIYRLEKKYSRYRNDSLASEINRIAKNSAKKLRCITVDEETSNLLDYAAIAYEQSHGLFDITSGIYRRAWDFKLNRLPNESTLAQTHKLVGWDKLSWKNHKLVFSIQGMEIDFGGFVKEYAADLAATKLRQLGIHHGYVDLGGDLAIVGPQPDNSPWRIGIRNPRNPEAPIAFIDIVHGGVASSGDYERYMMVNGQRYCHIINPKTGWPVDYWSGVSVFSDLCLLAGTTSTIAMLMETTGKSWLEDLGVSAILIDQSCRLIIQKETGQRVPYFENSHLENVENPVSTTQKKDTNLTMESATKLKHCNKLQP